MEGPWEWLRSKRRLVVAWGKTKKVYNAEVIKVPSSASRSEETLASKSDEPSTVSKNRETLAASRNKETLAASSSDVPPTVSKSKHPQLLKEAPFVFELAAPAQCQTKHANLSMIVLF